MFHGLGFCIQLVPALKKEQQTIDLVWGNFFTVKDPARMILAVSAAMACAVLPGTLESLGMEQWRWRRLCWVSRIDASPRGNVKCVKIANVKTSKDL